MLATSSAPSIPKPCSSRLPNRPELPRLLAAFVLGTMARLVDCSSSREGDELPRLNTLLTRSRPPKAPPTPTVTMDSLVKRNLILKSHTTPSSRKVCRLKGGSQSAGNPLFLPWDGSGKGKSTLYSRVSTKTTLSPALAQRNLSCDTREDSLSPAAPSYQMKSQQPRLRLLDLHNSDKNKPVSFTN